jgi:hypothetical protein
MCYQQKKRVLVEEESSEEEPLQRRMEARVPILQRKGLGKDEAVSRFLKLIFFY